MNRWKIRLHLLPFFGEHRKMTTVTTAALREFIAARQEKDISNAEINRELAVLRRAFNLAIQSGRLLTKPYFPMLKERNTRTGFLERDQIERICAALEATETADDGRKKAGELANVVRFAYATGWRTASEVLPLEWRNVDWEGRCVRLDPGTTKNGDGRSFPFTTDIENVLKAQRAIHDTLKKAGKVVPFVFHRDGERTGISEQRGRTPAQKPVALTRSFTTCAGQRSARSSGRECHGRLRCRWSATRPRASIGAMPSWTRPCSAKPLPAWTPSRPPHSPARGPARSRRSSRRRRGSRNRAVSGRRRGAAVNLQVIGE
jgi:integrase